MRHIEATVVDRTHLRVHPPLAMPVGAVVRLAIVTADIAPHTAPKSRAARTPHGARRTLAKDNALRALAGTLSAADARAMQAVIATEFGKVEGEWYN